jgi:DHA2 family methylenomycin A resistance protein-like MFS transporter
VRRALGSLPLALVLLDVTAVAVLVPDIRLDLGSSSSGAQWMLNAYLLGLAALLPLLAHASLPPRALAACGALAMAAGAVLCATADSTSLLVAGRAVAGAGAAALLASTGRGALTSVALPGLVFALGPLVGGGFAEQDWWRLFFWAGVPLAGVAAAAALLASPGERLPRSGGLARRLAFAGGLTALTIGLVETDVWAWGWSALLLLAGAVLLRMARLREAPGAALGWATAAGCIVTLVFLMPEYFQLARNLSALRSGTLLLAVTIPAALTWAISRRLTSRVPATALALTGLAGAALGLAALIAIDAATGYPLVVGGLFIAAAGLAAIGAAVGGVPGLESRSRPLPAALAGAVLGLAVAGASFQAAQSDEREAGASFEQALAAGVGWAALCLVFLLAAAALLSWRLRRASSAAHPAAAS